MRDQATRPFFATGLGASRFVLLAGPWALKFPRVDRSEFNSPWQRFLQGLRCNRAEQRLWTARANPMLCPVLWTAPFGLIVAMPRATPMSQDEFDAWWGSEEWFRHRGPQIFEDSAKDAGFLPDGRRVILDYGVEGFR